MATQLLTPTIGAIEAAFRAHVEMENSRGPSAPREYLYASARRKCLRRSVLEATQPGVFSHFDTDAKARMARGEQRERDLIIDLKRAGRLADPSFDIIGEQEAVKIYGRDRSLLISGKIDGRIRWADGTSWPLEIKAWSPFIVQKIDVFSDLYQNPWTWSGAHQLLSYLYAKPEKTGVLILDRPGIPKLIEVNLEENLEQMEGFLADAAAVVNHIKSGTLPNFIQDASECGRCAAHGNICNPAISSGDGALILTDPELEVMLERREALKDASHEYDSIDKEVKSKLRGVEMGIAGSFAITGKWGKSTNTNYPEDIKKLYSVSDPKGRFTLEITKL